MGTMTLIFPIMAIMMIIGMCLLGRGHDKRTWKIGAKDGQEEKLPLRFDARARGQIGAQVAFGEQVRKERGQTQVDG